MQLQGYRQDSSPTTPLLNYRSSITLEVMHSMRADYAVMAANDVRGLEVFDFNAGKPSSVIFESDRVNLEQLQEFIFKYDSLDKDSQPLGNNRISITSTPIAEGKIVGFNARIRGMRIESNIAIEVPNTSSYGPEQAESAFTFIGSASDFGTEDDIQLSNPNTVSQDESYIIEPSFGKKFRYSDSSTEIAYHVKAASELNIPISSIVYVGQTTTTSLNPFS